MKLQPFFSFFGAKWRATKLYPEPIYNTIIEPFAGSACFSLHFSSRKIILVDKDPTIANLWKWLISNPKDEIIELPIDIATIDDLPSWVSQPARDLIGFWFVKGSPIPARKRYAWARVSEWSYQFWGQEIKDRILRQLPYIKNWEAHCASFDELYDNLEASWFIDPPYERFGKRYRYHNICYPALGEWCKRRKGQIIVCEQSGAQWLPFSQLGTIKSLKSKTSNEVYYTYPSVMPGKLFREIKTYT